MVKAGGKRGGGTRALKKLIHLLLAVGGKRILILLGLSVARTALSNRLARIQGFLFKSAFLRRTPVFLRNLAENILLCLTSSAIESTLTSVIRALELQWRDRLTDRLHRGYFDDMVYYRMSYVDKRVDNPEQRICEDIPKFASGLADLTGEDTTRKSVTGMHGCLSLPVPGRPRRPPAEETFRRWGDSLCRSLSLACRGVGQRGDRGRLLQLEAQELHREQLLHDGDHRLHPGGRNRDLGAQPALWQPLQEAADARG